MSNYLDNLELFDESARRDGRNLYKQGKVSLKEAAPNKVKALVFGLSPYEVNLSFDASRDLIGATCSCDQAGFCLHMAATLYQISDYYSSHEETIDEEAEAEAAKALDNALEDIYKAIYRFNYKGLSKAMEAFISLLVKAGPQGRLKAVRDFLSLMFVKGRDSIDYDRLTPYLREILKKAALEEETLSNLLKEYIKEKSGNEQFYAIMLRDPEFSLFFQRVASLGMDEGVEVPFYLSSFAPVSSWAAVLPEFLEKLLRSMPFYATEEDMIALLLKTKARKEDDALFKLFGIAVEHFPGLDIPASIRESLIAKEEYREKMETIFFKALNSDFSPEKYLHWRSVVSDEDFAKRLSSLIESNPTVEVDFILLVEGRDQVGDLYDKLRVSAIPFPSLCGKLDNVKEQWVIDDLLSYASKEEEKAKKNPPRHIDEWLSLLDIYAHFDHESLFALLRCRELSSLAESSPLLRGKMLNVAYECDALSLLGVREYRR